MMSNSRLRTDILLYLYEKAPDDKTSLTELCEVLDGSTRESVVEALDHLAAKDYVARTGLKRLRILCWLTDTGRIMVREIAGADGAESDDEEESYQAPSREPGTGTREEYSDSSWTLDGLDPRYVYIVQRQDLVDRILRILEDPSGTRLAFLYGPPQVGKTFVLNRLNETLRDRYAPVFIHVNGWLSIGKLSDFLHELANTIQYGIKPLGVEYPIKPFIPGPESQATAEFSRFMNDLVQSMQADERILLLMFDDLEYLAREETDRRIFEYLTGFIEAHFQQVRFVFAGSGHLLELLRHGSLAMLWRRGESVHVDCFDEEVSRELVIHLSHPYFEFDSRALDRVICLIDGNPSFLRQALAIIFREWRERWRKEIVDENDLSTVIKDICTELHPKVTDVWCSLSHTAQDALCRIAYRDRKSFKMQDIVAKDQPDVENCLDQLVNHEILDYAPQDRQYTVRLGLLTESLSRGILSLSD